MWFLFASAIEGTADGYYFLAPVVTHFLWFQKPSEEPSLWEHSSVQIDFYLGFCSLPVISYRFSVWPHSPLAYNERIIVISLSLCTDWTWVSLSFGQTAVTR